MCYCESGHIDKLKFDSDITILFNANNSVFPDNLFNSYKDIVKCSQINVGVCFGASAIALDAAFETAGFSCKKRPLDDIRTIVYMVRCAFAHNIADPKWEVKGDFWRQVKLTVEGQTLSIDFRKLNGRPFTYEAVGELPNWYRIKKIAIEMIKNFNHNKAVT